MVVVLSHGNQLIQNRTLVELSLTPIEAMAVVASPVGLHKHCNVGGCVLLAGGSRKDGGDGGDGEDEDTDDHTAGFNEI